MTKTNQMNRSLSHSRTIKCSHLGSPAHSILQFNYTPRTTDYRCNIDNRHILVLPLPLTPRHIRIAIDDDNCQEVYNLTGTPSLSTDRNMLKILPCIVALSSKRSQSTNWTEYLRIITSIPCMSYSTSYLYCTLIECTYSSSCSFFCIADLIRLSETIRIGCT